MGKGSQVGRTSLAPALSYTHLCCPEALHHSQLYLGGMPCAGIVRAVISNADTFGYIFLGNNKKVKLYCWLDTIKQKCTHTTHAWTHIHYRLLQIYSVLLHPALTSIQFCGNTCHIRVEYLYQVTILSLEVNRYPCNGLFV